MLRGYIRGYYWGSVHRKGVVNVIKHKFFKITMPNGKSFVVISNNGRAGLIGLFAGIEDGKNTYITPISLAELIKYMIKKIKE